MVVLKRREGKEEEEEGGGKRKRRTRSTSSVEVERDIVVSSKDKKRMPLARRSNCSRSQSLYCSSLAFDARERSSLSYSSHGMSFASF